MPQKKCNFNHFLLSQAIVPLASSPGHSCVLDVVLTENSFALLGTI